MTIRSHLFAFLITTDRQKKMKMIANRNHGSRLVNNYRPLQAVGAFILVARNGKSGFSIKKKKKRKILHLLCFAKNKGKIFLPVNMINDVWDTK